MLGQTILIIDAEKPSVEMLSALLKDSGFEVYAAFCGRSGLRLAYQHQPDLVLLDVVLPDRAGWDICRQLRDLSDMPIIFLSARNDKADVIKGLKLGADDYLSKPFDNEELLARIRARLRRSPKNSHLEELVFNDGDIRINFLNREVWVRHSPRHLTPKEFSLLAVLARNAGRVLTRAELVTEAWGEEYSDASDSVKLYIHYLRKKLEANPRQPRYILTARGLGYRFMRR